ncbi:uncharacterized protein LOC126606238 [Malus sylvestris]|uniref:uncharacterized protein LOC126606238 n=1 Tax=Malus sylvestris TaxID=3752 RepID=UPI0021AD0405|nr:uncharacterized protein LOC126606238 [Malus sylvestris]
MSVFVAAVFDIFNVEKTEHGVGTLTELSGLIGTSWGGLDHPEEIHGTNCSGTKHLDLIGTSRDGLNQPEEIHGIDGSGTDELAGHRSHCMAAVGGRDDGFFTAIGEEDGKCFRWWRRRRSEDRFGGGPFELWVVHVSTNIFFASVKQEEKETSPFFFCKRQQQPPNKNHESIKRMKIPF